MDTIEQFVSLYLDRDLELDEIVEKQLPIDEKSIQNLITARTNIFNSEVNDLASRLYTGDISIGAWEETMKKLIREFHTSTAVIGKGGFENMTWQDWGRLGPVLREQYKYLHSFAEHIEANKETVSLKYIQARAQMYGDAAGVSRIVIEAGTYFRKVLPWLPKDGQSECLVRCKCFWSLEITKKTKTYQEVTAIWHLRPAEHCKTCRGRNNHVEVLRVPLNVDVPPQIG